MRFVGLVLVALFCAMLRSRRFDGDHFLVKVNAVHLECNREERNR